MRIEIEHTNTKIVGKLICKMIKMNEKSDYNYFENDTLYVGFNATSGFSYIYLESSPSISLALDGDDKLCIIYSSLLDGLEFIRYDVNKIKSLSKLEDIMRIAYELEYDIRDDDYDDAKSKVKFIKEMTSIGWEKL